MNLNTKLSNNLVNFSRKSKILKYWQQTTQDIENNLSDKLHEGLINRFVDSTSKYFINLNNDDKLI